jgi:ribosomal protein S27AE
MVTCSFLYSDNTLKGAVLGQQKMPVAPKCGDIVMPAEHEQRWRHAARLPDSVTSWTWQVVRIVHILGRGDIGVYVSPVQLNE